MDIDTADRSATPTFDPFDGMPSVCLVKYYGVRTAPERRQPTGTQWPATWHVLAR